jgi:hypothetical protein
MHVPARDLLPAIITYHPDPAGHAAVMQVLIDVVLRRLGLLNPEPVLAQEPVTSAL